MGNSLNRGETRGTVSVSGAFFGIGLVFRGGSGRRRYKLNAPGKLGAVCFAREGAGKGIATGANRGASAIRLAESGKMRVLVELLRSSAFSQGDQDSLAFLGFGLYV